MNAAIAIIVVVTSCLLAHFTVVESQPQSSPVGPGIPSSWIRPAPEEVVAARELLSSLLRRDYAANVPLVNALMPGDEPCQPVGHGASTVSDLAPGFCGSQPDATNLLDNDKGGVYTDASGKSHVEYGDMMASDEVLSVPLPPCAWRWLSCARGRIVAVDLSCPPGQSLCPFPPLGGALPAVATKLSALKSLDLSGNEGLGGGLPLAAMAPAWPSLTVLKMSACGLAGALPSDWSVVPSLDVLDLSFNRLQGALPPVLAGLSRLRVLNLAGNGELTGSLPTSWEVMAQLHTLDVRGVCRLCGSTTIFRGLAIALTAGSHVDQRCRPDDCDGGAQGLQGVFQGVMAAFASVLGLTATVLVLRRVRECRGGRNSTARAGEGRGAPSSSSALEGGSGAEAAAAHRVRRARVGRRRYPGGPAQAVPLYTVEFGPDGWMKWTMEMTGPAGYQARRRHWQEVSQSDEAAGTAEEGRGGGGHGGADGAGVAEVVVGAADPAVLPMTELNDPMAPVLPAAAVAGEGDGEALPADGSSEPVHAPEGVAAPAALLIDDDDATEPAAATVVAAAEAGASGQLGSAEPTPPPDDRNRSLPASPSGAARASRRSLRDAAWNLPQPPDAVILMPNGNEVCLGVRQWYGANETCSATRILSNMAGSGRGVDVAGISGATAANSITVSVRNTSSAGSSGGRSGEDVGATGSDTLTEPAERCRVGDRFHGR